MKARSEARSSPAGEAVFWATTFSATTLFLSPTSGDWALRSGPGLHDVEVGANHRCRIGLRSQACRYGPPYGISEAARFKFWSVKRARAGRWNPCCAVAPC